MDEALRRLHRDALADPTDGARRAAYGRALLQQGRRVAAANELGAALYLGGEVSGQVRVEAPRRAGWAATTWLIRLPGIDTTKVSAPTVPDSRWPHAQLMAEQADGKRLPVCLVPYPACARCACDDCGGRNDLGTDDLVDMVDEELLERGIDPDSICATCRGAGRRPRECKPCVSSGLLLQERNLTRGCPGCGNLHVEDAAPEEYLLSERWQLLRCLPCGLAALRRSPDRDDVPPGADEGVADSSLVYACPSCGLFACSGDCAAVAW